MTTSTVPSEARSTNDRLLALMCWYQICIGFIHAIATPFYHSAFTIEAVWFGSGGLAMAAIGGLNLRNCQMRPQQLSVYILTALLNFSMAFCAAAIAYFAWPKINALLVALSCGLYT